MKKQPGEMAWTHVPPLIPFRCLYPLPWPLRLQCSAAAVASVAVPMPLSPLLFPWDDSSSCL